MDMGSIIDEESYIMGEHCLDIDFRHMQLLRDIMIDKGEVIGMW